MIVVACYLMTLYGQNAFI